MFRCIVNLCREEMLAPRAKLKLEDHPLLAARLLIQYNRSCLPYWRPLLHPQPEDAPCRGGRDPLIVASRETNDLNSLQSCSKSFILSLLYLAKNRD